MHESRHTYRWTTAHIRNRHVMNMITPCHTYGQVVSHVWMSHDTHMNESWRTYEWVMAHIWMSHGAPMNESWHTWEWVTAHIWVRHVTCTNESWHTRAWISSQIGKYVWHDSFICVTWLIHMCDMTHSYATRLLPCQFCTSFGKNMNESWVMSHLRTRPLIGILWNESKEFHKESWHTYEWVMAHVCTSHGHLSGSSGTKARSFTKSHGTHMNESQSPIGILWDEIKVFPKKSWHRHECVMAHVWMCHSHLSGSFESKWRCSRKSHSTHVMHINESWHTNEWVMAHVWISHGTHIDELFTHRNCVRQKKGASKRVMTHIWISHDTQMKCSQKSHGTHINKSWHTYE